MSDKKNFYKQYKLDKKDFDGYVSILPLLLEIAKENKYVLSFWIHGSRSDRKHDERSDLDVGFIVANKKAKGALKEELKRYFYYKEFYDYFFKRVFEYWEHEGKVIGPYICDRDELIVKADAFFESVESLEKHQDFFEHTILQSKVIYDPKLILSKIKKKLLDCPTSLKKEATELFLKRIKQEAEWWAMRKKWKSVFEEISVLKPFFDEVAKCHYLLNDRYCMRSLKQYAIDLRDLKPDIRRELSFLTKIGTDISGHTRKLEIMNSLFKRLERAYQRKFETDQSIKL